MFSKLIVTFLKVKSKYQNSECVSVTGDEVSFANVLHICTNVYAVCVCGNHFPPGLIVYLNTRFHFLIEDAVQ